MKKFLTIAMISGALTLAAAAEKHNLTLFQPSMVNGTELAPGDYRMEVDGDKIVISKGKQKVEANIKVDTADSKFNTTSVRYATADGKYQVQEIRLGGTNRKLVLNDTQAGI